MKFAFGEHVAVTGASGAGKSTLLAVLLGFVTPAAGMLTVGGVELGDLPMRDWRQQIAWAGRAYLVRGTVADNICLADTNASDSAVGRAIEQSGLGGVLEQFQRRVKDPVGEGGLTLVPGSASGSR